MVSCMYQGIVRHERLRPVKHRFQYRTWMVYLDMSELAEIQRKCSLISNRQFAPFSFLRTDHLGEPKIPLDRWVRERVHAETGLKLAGPIRLLTQLRQWGQYFSPLNLYYCWDRPAGEIAAVLAEVTNIPWGEKHVYCLWEGNRQSALEHLRFEHDKAFHVSPFMDMQQSYAWHLSEPGKLLRVAIESQEAGEPLFRAELEMKQKDLSSKALAWQMVRQPVPAVQIITAIHYQALKLWWKKCPVYPHPTKRSALQRQSN